MWGYDAMHRKPKQKTDVDSKLTKCMAYNICGNYSWHFIMYHPNDKRRMSKMLTQKQHTEIRNGKIE